MKRRDRRFRNTIHTTARGTRIKLKDLDDEHLENIIAYIERNRYIVTSMTHQRMYARYDKYVAEREYRKNTVYEEDYSQWNV